MTEVPDKRHPVERDYKLYDATFCIIAARFNTDIVTRLVAGAVAALEAHGVPSASIDTLEVPGAFEVPLAVQQAANSKRYDGLIALAAVVRGGTPHFDYVSNASINGINQIMLECSIPVGNGVLTVDDMTQAVDRAGGSEGNKGAEAALAAMDMVHLLRELED